jgi:hypothetical protein
VNHNAEHAACQPDCALWEATVASLNVTYVGLTQQLGNSIGQRPVRGPEVPGRGSLARHAAGAGVDCPAADAHHGQANPQPGALVHQGTDQKADRRSSTPSPSRHPKASLGPAAG